MRQEDRTASSRPTDRSLGEHLGITDAEIWSRLDLVGVGADDLDALNACRDFIGAHVDHLVDEFYERQLEVDEIAVVVGDADTLLRLSQAMRTYVLDIFDAEFSAEYVNSRLRIGMVHKRIGVSPKLFLSSVRILKDVLRETFERCVAEVPPGRADTALDAFDKVTTFDSALVFDAYLRSLLNEIDTAWARSEDSARDAERRLTERTRRLEAQARRDSLTGLLNRRGLREATTRVLTESLIESKPVTLAYIDVDDFKTINDVHGHATGDTVLRAVAASIERGCRDHDVLARYGGDEFCVLLVDCGIDQAEIVMDRILSHVADIEPSTTLSIGLAQTTSITHPDGAELFKRADALMYEAKKEPGDQIRR
ncbi:MAG: GGDEF domain-containing protein [Actinomycetota bacterium]